MITAPDALVNLRDLGTVHPRLRHGVLLRSDAPHPGDVHAEYQVSWPPRTVVDLRGVDETGTPHPLGDLAQVVELPILGAAVEDYSTLPPLDVVYAGMLQAPRSGQLVKAVEAVATAPTPVLVHCAAGKDRTGVVVAVVLRLLGIEHDAIVADYVLTELAMDGILARWQRRMEILELASELPEVPGDHVRALPATMRTFLDRLDGREGGAEGWFVASGGALDTLAALRERLLG